MALDVYWDLVIYKNPPQDCALNWALGAQSVNHFDFEMFLTKVRASVQNIIWILKECSFGYS